MARDDSSTRFRVASTAREIFIVVSSILIAFGLDAGWSAVRAASERDDILNGLLNDFESNADQLAERVQVNQRGQQNAELLLAVFDESSGRTVLVSDSLVAAVLWPPTYDPNAATLDGLLASRGLDVLRHPVLPGLLASWRQKLDDNREDERLAVELVRPLTLALGRTASPQRLLESLGRLQDGEVLPGVFPVDTGDLELRSLVALRAFYFHFIAIELKEMVDMEAEVIEILLEALDPT